jgi:hypothetical protein
MRTVFGVATIAIIAMLAVPADAQTMNGIGAAQGAGRAQQAGKQGDPVVDPEQKKKDEKAFNDAVSRIPPAAKKYDPWGNVRSSGK